MANTVKIRKGNRVISISESQKASYLVRGYDVIDEKTGEITEHATGGKTVSIAEHNEVLKKLAKANKGGNDSKKVAELEEKISDLKSEISLLEKENERLDGIVKRNQSQRNANK